MRLARLMRPGRVGRAVIALASIAVMLVAANIVVDRLPPLRLDLTAEHLYTLSRGTRHTLAELDEPVTLRFYYSSRIGDAAPAYGVYAQRVRELLDQYVAAARGKIRLEVYDPQPFSDAEDRAVGYGLQGVPLNEQGETVYFGLAGTNSTDDQQVIPFFHPERERFLEYDLTRVVHALANPKRTAVGLLTGLPLDGGEPTPLIEQLRQSDDVKDLPLDTTAIPPGIDVLLIVHPQNLGDATQYAIDQYVLKGGKALIFVDPYSELQASRPGGASAATGSDMERLFNAWGVRMIPGVVAGDRRAARKVAVPVAGGSPQAIDYVGWLNLQSSNLSHDDPITADLSQVAMASAGILQPIEGATTKFDPLIQTSTDSEEIPVDKVKGLPDVAGLLAHFRPEQRRYTLAAHITGKAATAFPDGPPQGATVTGEPVKESAQPINIVVVADSDMLDARFWAEERDFYGRRVVVPIANNADFVANAVEVLAGGQDLVDLRSRGTVARPFEVVERIQRAANDRYAAEQRTLEDQVKQAQTKLQSLTSADAPGGGAPSAEQAKEIDQFRAQLLQTRQKLREVQAALRENIERLKIMLEFVDIALLPVILTATAVVMAALRARRRRDRPSSA